MLGKARLQNGSSAATARRTASNKSELSCAHAHCCWFGDRKGARVPQPSLRSLPGAQRASWMAGPPLCCLAVISWLLLGQPHVVARCCVSTIASSALAPHRPAPSNPRTSGTLADATRLLLPQISIITRQTQAPCTCKHAPDPPLVAVAPFSASPTDRPPIPAFRQAAPDALPAPQWCDSDGTWSPGGGQRSPRGPWQHPGLPPAPPAQRT